MGTRISTTTALALAAVVLSATTTVYAVSTLPKHSVGSKQLKTSSVTSTKIANKAVTGSKVKPNALGATQINESSLGQVPSAASAVNATNAANATTATNATNAANATQLGGKTASDFVGRQRIAFGQGVAASTTATTVLTLPTIGVTVKTDGDSDTTPEVLVTVPSTAPSFTWAVSMDGASMFSFMGGSPLSLSPASGNSFMVHIWRFDTSAGFLLNCTFDTTGFTSARPLSCWAIST